MRSAFSSVTNAALWRSSGGTRSRAFRARRGEFLRAVLWALLLGTPATFAAADPNAVFTHVVSQARAAAASPFAPNEMPLPDVLQKLNYDTYRNITFRQQRSLWHDSEAPFRVQFFHPGYLFRQPVAINVIENGQTRPLPFSANYFRYPDFDPAKMGDKNTLGFAGLRILYPLNAARRLDEVISFVGSSYFRALGAGQTYGISARGIAIDTGENPSEEFPAFKEFWLLRPQPEAREVEFFALLDGPSVTGAYRFVVKPGADTMVEVDAHLFFRKAVHILGIAPLTSMFWRGENQPAPRHDRRPEVHDSDGLIIEHGGGKEEWHSLEPVDKVITQVFPETNPKSFGLLQRDRDPSHYRDREAKYERRPSVRVDSLGDWGPGNVRLMQLPATNEYNDNVVVFWQPQKTPAAGDELEIRYRLHWFTQKSNKD
jgi:periplasmic glucans biosynthesis protein